MLTLRRQVNKRRIQLEDFLYIITSHSISSLYQYSSTFRPPSIPLRQLTPGQASISIWTMHLASPSPKREILTRYMCSADKRQSTHTKRKGNMGHKVMGPEQRSTNKHRISSKVRRLYATSCHPIHPCPYPSSKPSYSYSLLCRHQTNQV